MPQIREWVGYDGPRWSRETWGGAIVHSAGDVGPVPIPRDLGQRAHTRLSAGVDQLVSEDGLGIRWPEPFGYYQMPDGEIWATDRGFSSVIEAWVG